MNCKKIQFVGNSDELHPTEKTMLPNITIWMPLFPLATGSIPYVRPNSANGALIFYVSLPYVVM